MFYWEMSILTSKFLLIDFFLEVSTLTGHSWEKQDFSIYSIVYWKNIFRLEKWFPERFVCLPLGEIEENSRNSKVFL